MNSNAKCLISNQLSNKICINPGCTDSPFICNYCQSNACQNMHFHAGDLSFVQHNYFISFIQSAERERKGSSFETNIQKIKKEVQKLIRDINSLLQIYIGRIQQHNKQLKLNDQEQQVLNNIKQQRFGSITGRQIHMLYKIFKAESFKNSVDLIERKRIQQFKLVQKALNKIRETIKIYDEIDIIKKWSVEDQQKMNKYNKQIYDHPTNEKAYFNRGLLYYSNKQFEKSLMEYSKAIQYDPNFLMAYNNRASLYKKKNMFQEALMDFTKAIQCDKQMKIIYKNRALVYRKLNMLQEAEADQKKSVQTRHKRH